MQEVPSEEVIRRLRLENPWWQPPFSIQGYISEWKPRPYLDLFLPLVQNRRVRRAVVLMGPRRVGKTFLLHHAIAALLRDGVVSPLQVCYVSLDSPVYVNLSLERLMRIYGEATGISLTETPVFLFFDEIQYLRGWEIQLKSIVDSYPGVKCIASGSAAAALKLKSNESGAGRFTEFLLPPVTFYEYLSLTQQETRVRVVQEDELGFSAEDLDGLNDAFVHYLNFGGYPEVIFSSEIQEDPVRFIKNDIIDKVLLRDLPSLYGIQDIQELNALFTSLAYNTAQEVSLEELSKNSGVAKATIKRYIEYLEAAFLIRTVRRVDEAGRYFQRARTFKVYLTNPSIRTALFSDLRSADRLMGALVETGIFAQWFPSRYHGELHYARWKKGEIDIVFLGPDQKARWAVEVKWSDRVVDHLDDLKEAIAFCRNNGLERLVVTTAGRTASRQVPGVDITFTPAALYAYALGYNIIDGDARF